MANLVDLSQFDPQRVVADCAGLQIGPLLGRGGQKAVWRCTYGGQDFALKVIASEAESRRRAIRELEVLMVCNSAYLPGLGPLPLRELDLGNGDAVLYYLEEFIPGTPLHQVAKPLTVEAVLDMGRSVAMALNEIWKNGYIHRDVKPLNIIQRTSGGYVLLDTGLALDFAASSITPMGGVVGTPAYLSPDQLQIPKRELDFRSDLFSLGITMYECATGQHPFWNPLVPTGDVRYNIVQSPCPHPQRWNNSLPDGLCEAILRMLEKERHLRYSRIEHLLEDLDKVTP